MSHAMIAAHRGVAAGAAENTIAAFTNAVDVGADMVEFDVRRTCDRELIAFHDATVGGVPVNCLTRDEIEAAAGVKPPLLAEVLRVCAGRIRLDVELKEDGYVQDVMAVLRASFDPAQMIITSFLPSVVAQAKDAFPEVKTGLLVGDGGSLTDVAARLRELYPVDVARRVRADYLAPHYRLAALGVLRRAAAAGLPCLLWTVNSPVLIRRYATDPRVAAIITDVAAEAVSIVAGAARLDRRPEAVGLAGGEASPVDVDLVVDDLQVLLDLRQLGEHVGAMGLQEGQPFRLVARAGRDQFGVAADALDGHAGGAQFGADDDPLEVEFPVPAAAAARPVDRADDQAGALVVAEGVHADPGAAGGLGDGHAFLGHGAAVRLRPGGTGGWLRFDFEHALNPSVVA
jgi:glycerophosphoryl diester phosphodiesterase